MLTTKKFWFNFIFRVIKFCPVLTSYSIFSCICAGLKALLINGNKTEWSPNRSVIVREIKTSTSFYKVSLLNWLL